MKARFFVLLILSAITGVSSGANPQVTLQITGDVNGNIVLELYADQAPVTVANFIDYVQSGFYDGLIFHRVIEDFMIQGGGFDPNLVPATPGPAIINESTNGLANFRGTVAMARATAPHTATSQFYINHIDNPFLDFGAIAYNGNTAYYRVGYCVFGEVISGLEEVVDAIALVPTADEGGMNDVPVNDVVIQSATVTLNTPFCPEKLDGDTDGDCDVDFADFVTLAGNWLQCNSTTTTCN
jgi:cyclophilin family peptidyl-prolyl cis-trans isomerase